MRVLLIGDDLLADLVEAVAPVYCNPLGEDLVELRSGSPSALCRFDVRFEHESVTVEPLGLEIGDDVGYLPAGCRPVAIDDHEAIDIALSVCLPERRFQR